MGDTPPVEFYVSAAGPGQVTRTGSKLAVTISVSLGQNVCWATTHGLTIGSRRTRIDRSVTVTSAPLLSAPQPLTKRLAAALQVPLRRDLPSGSVSRMGSAHRW